jgi:hypothetical protein
VQLESAQIIQVTSKPFTMTRIIFAILMLLFLSCTKYERKQRQTPNPTGFSIDIRINDKSSTGEVTERTAPVAMIHVWKSDNRNFHIISVGAAIDGYATDKISDRLVSAYYTSLSTPAFQNATEGKYFVFVILDDSPSVGKFAYSYTPFEVIKGQRTELKKTFTTRIANNQFEEWNASE